MAGRKRRRSNFSIGFHPTLRRCGHGTRQLRRFWPKSPSWKPYPCGCNCARIGSMEKQRFDEMTDLVEHAQQAPEQQPATSDERQVENAQGEKITLDDKDAR